MSSSTSITPESGNISEFSVFLDQYIIIVTKLGIKAGKFLESIYKFLPSPDFTIKSTPSPVGKFTHNV
jgi:hypothetical protein